MPRPYVPFPTCYCRDARHHERHPRWWQRGTARLRFQCRQSKEMEHFLCPCCVCTRALLRSTSLVVVRGRRVYAIPRCRLPKHLDRAGLVEVQRLNHRIFGRETSPINFKHAAPARHVTVTHLSLSAAPPAALFPVVYSKHAQRHHSVAGAMR